MTRDALLKTIPTTSTITTINSNSSKITPCLDHIFSFLDSKKDLLKASLVSKIWHQKVAKRLWSNFKFIKEREFERIFHILSKRSTTIPYGNLITSLDLTHSDRDFSINSNHIFLITMLCPNLESIAITFHHTRLVAPPVAQHLLGNRKPSTPAQRPPLPLPMMARQQQQQQQHIQHIQQLQPQAPKPLPQQQSQQPIHTPILPLAHFAHNCPKLKSIRLVSYSPKTDDSVYEMAKFLTSGSLESITLSSCSTIQSSTLCKLAITNPQLKCIEIMGSTPISDSSLATLVDRCGSTLEYLSIGNAHQLTDKSMRYVPLRCKKIRQICIFNNTERVSEDTLTAMITHCPTLQTISLSDSRCLGSTFFNSVVQRVNIEMANILQHQATARSGLQRLCLGGVRREMITSRYMHELIDKSASKNDLQAAVDDQDDENDDVENQLSHIIDTTKFMPKSTVIRGSTVWWQRRRLIMTPAT